MKTPLKVSNPVLSGQLIALIREIFVSNGFTVKSGREDLADYVYRAAEELLTTFQRECSEWAISTFGEEATNYVPLRTHRFIEESLELAQALGCRKETVLQLVDYVFGRPKGEPYQEVGGTMTTLAVLCHAAGLNMAQDGYTELFRVKQPETQEQIRQKHLNKPKFGPLPE